MDLERCLVMQQYSSNLMFSEHADSAQPRKTSCFTIQVGGETGHETTNRMHKIVTFNLSISFPNCTQSHVVTYTN